MARRHWLVPLAVVGALLLYRSLRRGSTHQMTAASWEFTGPMARVYDLLFSSLIDGFYARLARRLTATTPSGQVLDVGCGPGRLAVHLARQAPGLWKCSFASGGSAQAVLDNPSDALLSVAA